MQDFKQGNDKNYQIWFRSITLSTYAEWVGGGKFEGKGTSWKFIAIIQKGL